MVHFRPLRGYLHNICMCIDEWVYNTYEYCKAMPLIKSVIYVMIVMLLYIHIDIFSAGDYVIMEL